MNTSSLIVSRLFAGVAWICFSSAIFLVAHAHYLAVAIAVMLMFVSTLFANHFMQRYQLFQDYIADLEEEEIQDDITEPVEPSSGNHIYSAGDVGGRPS